jgi:hypothetical protein
MPLSQKKDSIMRVNRRAFLAGIAALPAARVLAGPIRDAKDFGAAYDGSSDSFKAMQAALDWSSQTANPIQLSGPVRISDTLRYGSNVTLLGTDAAQIGGFDLEPGKALLNPGAKAMHSGGEAAFKNVTLRNIRFLGDGNTTKGSLIRFIATDGVTVDRCVLRDHRCMLIGLFGVGGASITQCEFTNWGAVTVKPPGPAIHMAADPNNRPSSSIEVAGNNFHDGTNVAISVYARDVILRDNHISNTLEGAIFAFRDRPGDQPNDAAVNLTILNNTISNVVQKDVSGTGIEIGASGALVRGNKISNTESSGILILDPSAHIVVTDNEVMDTVQKPGVFREHGQIQIIAEPITPDWPQDIAIIGNRVSNSSPDRVRAPYGIAVRVPFGEPPPISKLVIRDNVLAGGYVKEKIWIDPRLAGADAIIQNNG